MKRVNFKKTLAILLALVTMLASFSMLSIAAEEPDTLEGDGTEATPYLLNTPADLLALVEIGTLSNSSKKVYIKVTADIDMAGVEGFKSLKMGSSNELIFDGQNHKISNLTVTQGVSSNWVGGLFQQVRFGSIENIHMENITVDALETKNAVGGIVGYASLPFTMKNCSVSGTVTSNYTGTGNCSAAGLVSAIGEGSGEAVFERCLNQATVVNKGLQHAAAGGIIGGLEDASNYTFRYCLNEGAISTVSEQVASTAKPSTVGGILAFSKNIGGLGDEAAQVFENCVNLGDLSIADAALPNAMGGILGSGRAPNQETASNPPLQMTNCYDNSKRTFDAVLGFNGALAGVSTAMASWRSFTDCYAVNKADSANPYTAIQKDDQTDAALLEVTNSGIATAMDAAITLKSGKSTTVAAEIATIYASYLCPEHQFDNDCDADCNNPDCPYVREVPHAYDNDCDADCNLCGAARTAPHVYSNACDADCDACGATRTAADHVYSNDCDAECNVCEAERTPGEHVYDDDNDRFCNSCGEQRTLPAKTTTTAAPAKTTAAAADKKEEKKGCGGAITSTYAVLALVGVLGFAFVAKKKEEN